MNPVPPPSVFLRYISRQPTLSIIVPFPEVIRRASSTSQKESRESYRWNFSFTFSGLETNILIILSFLQSILIDKFSKLRYNQNFLNFSSNFHNSLRKKKFQLFSGQRERETANRKRKRERESKCQVLFETRFFGGRNRNPNGPSPRANSCADRATSRGIRKRWIEWSRRGGRGAHTALAGSGSRDSNPEARCRADLYELGRINNRESCLAGASHIYLSVARNREPRFQRVHDAKTGEGDSLYSPPSSFFLSTRCPHGKAARREEVGTERAEVTPAPRRSRGRAPPVRFDAFLSPPPSSLLFLCLSVGSASSLCHLPQSFNAVLTYG